MMFAILFLLGGGGMARATSLHYDTIEFCKDIMLKILFSWVTVWEQILY